MCCNHEVFGDQSAMSSFLKPRYLDWSRIPRAEEKLTIIPCSVGFAIQGNEFSVRLVEWMRRRNGSNAIRVEGGYNSSVAAAWTRAAMDLLTASRPTRSVWRKCDIILMTALQICNKLLFPLRLQLHPKDRGMKTEARRAGTYDGRRAQKSQSINKGRKREGENDHIWGHQYLSIVSFSSGCWRVSLHSRAQ